VIGERSSRRRRQRTVRSLLISPLSARAAARQGRADAQAMAGARLARPRRTGLF
jgi:hypothetical protein